MKAHLILRRGRLEWAGYNAGGGYPKGARYALVVDLGRDFQLTSDKPPLLYLTGPGPIQFTTLSAPALAIAARGGMFGFRVVSCDRRSLLRAGLEGFEARRRRKAVAR